MNFLSGRVQSVDSLFEAIAVIFDVAINLYFAFAAIHFINKYW
jgi:hypothetical protein